MQKSKLKLKSQKYLLFLVIFVALFLRIYKIAEYPAGLNADEAAIGYNAYSLLKTGKDEFGHPWPINFQSFNDYKPGLYFYLVLPFVKFLGLNELAIRLPSAVLGTLTVGVVYFLAKELLKDWSASKGFSRIANRNSFPEWAGVLGAFLLAISPWHLHFSRGSWEANVATFFVTFGLYSFFKALKNPKFFIFYFLFFIFAMYTYHSARIIAPGLGLILLLIYWKQIFVKKNIKWLLATFLTGLILVIPLIISFLGLAGISRFSGVGLLADQGPYWRAVELRVQHQNPFSLGSAFFHNRFLEYGIRFFDNYLRHFSGDFLFISGDEIQRNKVPEMGQMYLIEIPFLVLGFYFLLKNKPKNWQFLLLWLAISPVASAMTFQSPHAIRALNMIIPLLIIVAYGTVSVIELLKSKFNKRLFLVFICLLLIVYCWNFVLYLHQYYIHYPQTYPAAWEYGFKELVEYVKENESKYELVYVTNKYDQPYVLFAFYLRYPPEIFQKEAKLTPRDRFDFSTVEHFGKYYFGPIELEKLRKEGKAMIVGSSEEIPDSATILKRIYFKVGKREAFRIVEL